jgi:uncharacterized repeat protein (TIGR02543 family)
MVFAMIGVYADTPESEGEITPLGVAESYDLSVSDISITFTGNDTYSVTYNGVPENNLTSGAAGDVIHVVASGQIPDGRTINVNGNSQTISAPIQIEINGITAAGAGSRINLANGANVNLVAKGTNSLTSSNNAAIAVPEGTSILINGSGSLNAQAGAQSGGSAAGIGGVNGNFGHAGTIHINGDITVTAVGTATGAGIGGAGSTTGGYGGDAGNITIDGNSHVTASSPGQNSTGCGAGIGGGSEGTGGTIIIGGNAVVRAQSNSGSVESAAAAIGAGGNILRSNVTIKDNAVVYAYAAGIGCSAAIGGADCRRGGGGIGAAQDISINILDNAQVYAYKEALIGAAIGTGAVDGSQNKLTNLTINIGNNNGSGSPNVVAIGGTGYTGYSSPAIGYATKNKDMLGALNISVNAGKVIAYNQSTFDIAAIGATKGAPSTVNIKFGDEVSVVTVLNNNVGASTANTTSVRPVNGSGTSLYYLPIRTTNAKTSAPLTLVKTDLYKASTITGSPFRTDYSWGLEWIQEEFASDSIFSSDTTLTSFLNSGTKDVRGMIGYWLPADTYSLEGSKTNFLDKDILGTVLSTANATSPLIVPLSDSNADEFKFQVTVADGQTFYIPTSSQTGGFGKSYDWDIDWGDNSAIENKTQADSPNSYNADGIDHTYAAAGTYTITLSPHGSTEAWLGSFGFWVQTDGANAQVNKNLVTKVISPIKPNMTRTDAQIAGTIDPPTDEWMYTFYTCANLTMDNGFTFSPTAWEDITTVGDNFAFMMFNSCTNDYFTMGSSFNLPQNLTTVGNSFAAFMFYTSRGAAFNMNSIFNLPQDLETVGDSFAYGMFGNCYGTNFNMNSVFNLPQGLETVGNGFADSMFIICRGPAFTMNDVFNLPQDITTAGNRFAASMFYNASWTVFNMNDVFNLPQDLESVGNSFANSMFAYCRGIFTMNDVFNLPQELETVGSSFAYGMFDYTFGDSFTMNSIFNLPQGITTIGNDFAANMFLRAGGSQFQVNNAFVFPELSSTDLNRPGVLEKVFYVINANTPPQTRTIASIIKGNATPNDQKQTFGPQESPNLNRSSDAFSDWWYEPINWGCGGLTRGTIISASNYTVSVSNAQTSPAAIIAAAGANAHIFNKDSGNATFVGNISSSLSAIPKTPGTYYVTFTATSGDTAYGKSEITIKVTVIADVTFTVTYHSTGHTAGAAPSSTIHITGTNATIQPIGTLVRDGYTFSGWSKNVKATTVHYTPGAIINAISANVDLYAVWTKDTVVTPPVVNPPVVDPPVVDPPVVDPPVVDPPVVVNPPVVNPPVVNPPVVNPPVVNPPAGPTTVVTNADTTAADVDAVEGTTSTDVISGSNEGTPQSTGPSDGNIIAEDTLTENSPATLNIFGNDVPLFGKNGVATWAFLNLLLAIVGVIVTAFVIISAVIKRRKDDDEYADVEFYSEDEQEKSRTRKLFLILGTVAAVFGIVFFIITEDLSAQMVLMDTWTIVQAVICAATIVLGKFATRKQKDDLSEHA